MDHLQPFVMPDTTIAQVPRPPEPAPRVGAAELLNFFVAGTEEHAVT